MTKPAKPLATIKDPKRAAIPVVAKSFQKAKPEWLPLHVARMRFFPTYATEKTFLNDVKRLTTALARRDDLGVVEIAPYVVRIALGNVGLVIDADRGTIDLEPHAVEDEWPSILNDYSDMRARPERFPAVLSEAVVQPQYRKAARHQHGLAVRLIGSMKARFQDAIDNGGAEVFGRWRDLKSPFEPVYSDQWRRLVEATDADWSSGTDMSTVAADGRRGDVIIYSVHVQPHRKQESASQRAINDCKQFMIEAMRNQPRGGRIIQSQLENAAREKWPSDRLPERAMKRCFVEAKNETNSKDLVRPGRPPTLIHRTQ